MAKKKQEELTPEMATIKLWKKLKVSSIEFQFSCGGDNMGDTEFMVYGKKGILKSKGAKEIVSFFEDEIYKRVEFYECSDGHYIGEAGVVDITLVEDDEKIEAPYFQYDKTSTSEWSESFSNTAQVELNQEEADFIKTYIRSFEGGRDDNYVVNYSQDFIMSDAQEDIMQKLIERVHEIAANLEIEDDDGNVMEDEGDNDWYRFEYVNIDGENNMHVEVTKSFTIHKEDQ